MRPRVVSVLLASLLLESALAQQTVAAVLAAADRPTPGQADHLAAEQRVEALLTAGVLVVALAAWTAFCTSALHALRLAASAARPATLPATPRQGSVWVRAAALALGVGTVGLAAAGPASADADLGQPCPPPAAATAPPAGEPALRLDGLALPVLPTARGRASTTTSVVVAPGDSLWSLAASSLPNAAPGVVDRSWRRWYAANRRVIGPDPDLLLPGQRLRVPLSARTHRRTDP